MFFSDIHYVLLLLTYYNLGPSTITLLSNYAKRVKHEAREACFMVLCIDSNYSAFDLAVKCFINACAESDIKKAPITSADASDSSIRTAMAVSIPLDKDHMFCDSNMFVAYSIIRQMQETNKGSQINRMVPKVDILVIRISAKICPERKINLCKVPFNKFH